MTEHSVKPGVTLELYEGYAFNQLERWDAVVHPDVVTNSPAGRDIVGRDPLKAWVKAFIEAFELRLDLVDEFVAGDRGQVTLNLHWTHNGAPFFGIEPTGKSGTSVESLLLRLENGVVTRVDVADHSLDLAIYLYEQGMEMPTRVAPAPLIAG